LLLSDDDDDDDDDDDGDDDDDDDDDDSNSTSGNIGILSFKCTVMLYSPVVRVSSPSFRIYRP